ncbi:MAG: RIFT barrel domain-containing protein, partial [Burkholderiaceae bacterium]
MKYPISKTNLNLIISASVFFILTGCGGGGGGAAGYSAGSSGSATTTTTIGSTPTTTNPNTNTTPLILPASVPQPTVAGTDIVGVNLQNTTSSPLAAHIFTFGQIFQQGDVHSTDTLVAHITGVSTAAQVQLDTLATWPDGSVKLGAITLTTPVISAGSTVPVLLSKKTGSDPTFSTTPVDLVSASASTTLNASLTFTSGQSPQSANLAGLLHTALLSSPTYWLHGPLATQARIDVPLSGALHITADVTAYADNSVTADVQFNNDLTTILPSNGAVNPQAELPPLQYTATINLQGTQINRTVSQVQYTGWHVVLNSAGAPMLNVSSSTEPAINVQHDLAYLEHSGAVLPYDRTTGVANDSTQYGTTFYSIASVMGTAGFGTPLAINGLERYMAQTGGRPDIGYTTMWNTTWLLTQDSRAATVALAQGDAGGAVPWNYKLANGHWLTPGDWPNILIGFNGGPHNGTDGIANIAYTNYPGNDPAAWFPDPGHQPNLAYIPYIMTGQRWYLDRLNAQAAFGEISSTPFSSGPYQAAGRYAGQLLTGIVPSLAGTADIVIAPDNQLRAAAWTMREIQEAAFVGKPGSFEQGFFTQAVVDNWNYFLAMKPTLTAQQGQAAGWLPNTYGSGYPQIIMAPWQQDYFTGIAALGAMMGYSGAQGYINWQKGGWLSGRFITANNPYDGTAYNMVMSDPTGVLYTT